jgi:predicted ferric reductase
MSNGDAVHFGESTKSGLRSASLAVVDRRPVKHVGSGGDRLVRPWFGRPVWGALLCAVYPLLAIAPAIALRLLNRDVDYATATALGVNCALVGFTLLSMQFLLTARLPWIEAPFGLDLILRFHRTMAIVIVALLCVHPMLIADDQGGRLLTGLHMPWCIWAGPIALILLLSVVSAAVFRSAMRLSYEWWRHAHSAIALAILALGFAHAVTTGEDLQNPAGLALWTAMSATGLAAWFYAHAIRPRLLARRAFRVHSISLEAPRVWTITLAAPAGRPFRFLPGQFQFLRFVESNVPAEEHPFSVASSPSRAQHISLTIKACGNFTNLIDRIHVGDRATVHGPFGRFSCDLHPDEGHLVFVAGGVGITPLMSMLRAMRDRRESRQVTLIYASRQVNDVLFAPELVAMERAQCPALKVIYVLSKPPTWWAGQTGRVDAQRLDQWCGGVEDKAFYLCCPPQMNAELIAGLRRNGVSPRRIHCDDFSL